MCEIVILIYVIDKATPLKITSTNKPLINEWGCVCARVCFQFQEDLQSGSV